ncbi:MAG: NAD(P)/FAD-dependent oxidoreductase [Candidatus Aenigmatarchaeota archaeon]
MSLRCDVLVIGAGPAGSCAARAAAIKGADVILIEKKEYPGKVACGEAISNILLPMMPFRIPKDKLKWKLEGMSFYAEGINIERRGNFWGSYSLDRRDFDYWLAKEAVKAGAKLMTSTELIDVEHDKYFVEKAIANTKNGTVEIEPKIVIAADGVESTTLKSLGMYKPKKGDIAEVHSWEMSNLKLDKPELEHIYLGDFSDGGYAYIFPKSKTTANVGTGSMKNIKLDERFEEFLEIPEVNKQLKNGRKSIERSGKAPVRPFLEKVVHGNFIFVGDAAFQNFKPFVEGISPAIICGDIAGKICANHIYKSVRLESYPEKVKARIGFIFEDSRKITNALYEIFEIKDNRRYLANLALAANLFTYDELGKIKSYSYQEIKDKIENESKKFLIPKIEENLETLYVKIKSIIS